MIKIFRRKNLSVYSLPSSSLFTLRKSLYVANSNPNSQTPSISFPPHSVAAVSPPRSLKSRLKNGDTLYGTFLLTFSPKIAEIAGLAGYDFAVVDMEHGHGGISDATNTAAILRIPESSAAWSKKALDLGPQGIMFPKIEIGPESRVDPGIRSSGT